MVYYNRDKKDLYIPNGVGNDECEESVKTVNLTQAEYDALEDKDCSTYYNIVEE